MFLGITLQENSYAAVYSCDDNSPFGGGRTEFAWVLTRDQNPTSDVVRNTLIST